jgi:hypothetical protein
LWYLEPQSNTSHVAFPKLLCRLQPVRPADAAERVFGRRAPAPQVVCNILAAPHLLPICRFRGHRENWAAHCVLRWRQRSNIASYQHRFDPSIDLLWLWFVVLTSYWSVRLSLVRRDWFNFGLAENAHKKGYAVAILLLNCPSGPCVWPFCSFVKMQVHEPLHDFCTFLEMYFFRMETRTS